MGQLGENSFTWGQNPTMFFRALRWISQPQGMICSVNVSLHAALWQAPLSRALHHASFGPGRASKRGPFVSLETGPRMKKGPEKLGGSDLPGQKWTSGRSPMKPSTLPQKTATVTEQKTATWGYPGAKDKPQILRFQ